MQAQIFDIQRYSSHDGPGIRSTVFFKGCGLRCKWCHNPESFVMTNSLLYTPDSCIGCSLCTQACPQGAQLFTPAHVLDRSKCIGCGACAQACPCNALVVSGHSYTVEEVWEIVARDIPFYTSSGGGITLSGGEVLLQPDFAAALLKKCKAEGLHTAVDTAGFVPWEAFEKVLPYADMFLYDIKAITPALHREAVGQDNTLILENYSKLAETGAKIWVRIPVIPGYTEDPEELQRIARFLQDREPDSIDLLRFHRMAESKYRELGMEYAMGEVQPPSPDAMEYYKTMMTEYLSCEIRIG